MLPLYLDLYAQQIWETQNAIRGKETKNWTGNDQIKTGDKKQTLSLHNLNISDNDYTAAAYKSTHFTSSTLMQLSQSNSVLAKSKSVWNCNHYLKVHFHNFVQTKDLRNGNGSKLHPTWYLVKSTTTAVWKSDFSVSKKKGIFLQFQYKISLFTVEEPNCWCLETHVATKDKLYWDRASRHAHVHNL